MPFKNISVRVLSSNTKPIAFNLGFNIDPKLVWTYLSRSG
ncbi:hypothetical protein [Vibrio phage J14]|nr:hypothetical protein [Vibrio phage J14]